MQKKKQNAIFHKYSRIALLFAVSFMLNAIGTMISHTLSLPFWLDSIGTFLTASILGPVGGGFLGGISACLLSFGNFPKICYTFTGITVGVMAGLYFPRERNDYFQLVCTAAITSITAVIVSTPINMIFYEGHVGNIWGDALFNMLSQSGNSAIFCSVLGQGFVDIPDKVLSLFLATGIFQILKYLKNRKLTKENHS